MDHGRSRYSCGLGGVDNLETQYKIPLTTQEFWIQVKGLPLVLMTQAMGEEIERPLGTYITTDCNRGGDCLESAEDMGGIGCVQTVTVRDEDEVLGWQWGLGMGGFKVRNVAKHTFSAWEIRHRDVECERYTGVPMEDIDKPFGKWF